MCVHKHFEKIFSSLKFKHVIETFMNTRIEISIRNENIYFQVEEIDRYFLEILKNSFEIKFLWNS